MPMGPAMLDESTGGPSPGLSITGTLVKAR
jgi:hypothetical protein